MPENKNLTILVCEFLISIQVILKNKMNRQEKKRKEKRESEQIYFNIYRKIIYRFPYAKFINIFTFNQIAHYLQNVFDELELKIIIFVTKNEMRK